MPMRKPVFLLIAGLAPALFSPGILAADAPMRKSGLWEIKSETSAGGQKMPGPMTMQMCIDQSKDDMTADPKDAQDMRKRCSKMDMKRTGNATVIDSVCMMDGHTATGRTVITGTSVVTWASTVYAPPKMEWTPIPPSLTSTTSTSRPDPVRAASRPAISLPSADAAMSTPAGAADSTSDASTSTTGVTR